MENNKIKISVKIREAINSLLRICTNELRHIFSDAGVMVLIFAVPLIYPMLYSLIYYPEVVRDLPIAVVDMSHSSDSRRFIRNINSTPDLKVEANCNSMDEAITLFKKREVRGIVQIPESFSHDLAMGQQTTISAFADMEFFLYYKAMVTGISFVAIETGNRIQINNLINNGLTELQAETISKPLKLADNAMANQAAGFASYGLPAALILIIQQTLIIAIGILAGTARERNYFGSLVSIDSKRPGAHRIVTGKAAAYFIIYALLSIYMLGMIPRLFGYGQAAGFFELSALITPFILSSIFMGMTLSVLFKNRESSMMLYLFTSIPLLFLSGIIWPISNFGKIWLIIRDIFPSSNAILGYIKMDSLAASVYETRKEIMILWIQTGIYFLTSLTVYYYQVIYSIRLRGELISKPFREVRRRIAGAL